MTLESLEYLLATSRVSPVIKPHSTTKMDFCKKGISGACGENIYGELFSKILDQNVEVFGCLFVMRCAIWYYSYNLKNVKNTHGGVLILIKLQA